MLTAEWLEVGSKAGVCEPGGECLPQLLASSNWLERSQSRTSVFQMVFCSAGITRKPSGRRRQNEAWAQA